MRSARMTMPGRRHEGAGPLRAAIMKVTVIGGTGVFGSRLARMLVRDGHAVTVASRSGAQALAEGIGATALTFDRRGDLAALIGAEAVVDAAGPFHAYGDDPYRIARWCIDNRVHYLDLADEADFVAGIAALDAAARAAGVFALSGVSSVPALSSAAVAALARGMDGIDLIEGAIVPGNRTPRGRAVVESILFQLGQPISGQEDGVPCTWRGWSGPRVIDLGRGIARVAHHQPLPDQRLLPGHFAARTVTFRAGMELWAIRVPMAVASWGLARLNRRWPAALVPLALGWANLLRPFGSDRGGMEVAVTGRDGRGHIRRRWILRAERGDGPFIPGIAARTYLRDPAAIAPGARPALAELPLAAHEAALADLAVTTGMQEERPLPLFAQALGADFARLPPAVRALRDHIGPRRWRGEAEVTRGRGLVARIVAALFGFPPAGISPVEVRLAPEGRGLVWERRFGRHGFRSQVSAAPGRITERIGPFSFHLGLQLAEGRLEFPVTGGTLLGIPMPRVLLPRSEAAEWDEGGVFHFDVSLSLPLGLGPLVRYRGWLKRAVPELPLSPAGSAA